MLNKIRRKLYRSASILGDVNAVSKAVKKSSVRPLFNRFIRKHMWRSWNSFANKIFKGF